MNPKRNLVAHYSSGNSDKIYMACIRQEETSSGTTQWIVIGKWGRRGRPLSSQVKLITPHLTEAITEQRRLFHKKQVEGYEDISLPEYNGLVRLTDHAVASNLEKEQDLDELSAAAIKDTEEFMVNIWKKRAEPVKPKREDEKEDMTAICISLVGLEDKFDEGIEYVFENHEDPTMIYVYDKLGNKGEFFKDRFRLVKAS